MYNLIPQIITFICVPAHGIEELLKGLSSFLGTLFNIKFPKWFGYVLLAPALAIPIVPIILGMLGVIPHDEAVSATIGGLLADTIFTHWLPSLWKRSPGILSASLFYPILAFWLYTTTTHFSWTASVIGAGLFAGLWPTLLIMKGISLLINMRHQKESDFVDGFND